MTIKLDESDTSIVITCTQCPYWYSFRFDKIEAYKSGEQHAINVHAIEPRAAYTARYKWAAREATRRAIR